MPLRSVHRGFSKDDNAAGSGRPGRQPEAHRLDTVDNELQMPNGLHLHGPARVAHKEKQGGIGVTTMISQEIRQDDRYDGLGQGTMFRSADTASDRSLVHTITHTTFA